MDEKTLAALRGSIEKWRGVAAGNIEDRGWRNCPLCKKFRVVATDGLSVCDGCPVSERTGQDGCHGSPYWAFDDTPYYPRREYKRAARAELDFLISLLPTEEMRREEAQRT